MVTIKTHEGLCIQTEESLRLSGAEDTGREIGEPIIRMSCTTFLSFRTSQHALQGATYSGNNQRQILSQPTQW